MPPLSRLKDKLPGEFFLWSAIIILASAGAVTRKLTEIGSDRFAEGQNPVSFCNVLFVGNLCAVIILSIIYFKQLKPSQFTQFTGGQWGSIVAVALLAGALGPGAKFEAIAQTNVTNVILIGRLEPLIILTLAVLLLGERTTKLEVAGAVISTVGIVLIFVLELVFGQMGMSDSGWGSGEILAAVGTAALAMSHVISKAKLHRIPVGFFTVVRTALGSVVFYIAALQLYGPGHFSDLTSPFLWKWMLVYGAVIVAIGQTFWFMGLKQNSGSNISIASAVNPVIGIVAAFLILGEVPTMAQFIGGAVVLAGIVVEQFGVLNKSDEDGESARPAEEDYPHSGEQGMGFKGV